MKAVLSLLVAASLLVGLAHSLKCYNCGQSNNIKVCSDVTDCPGITDPSCVTVTSTSSAGTLIAKTCTAGCKENTINDPLGGKVTTTCCKTDLCNGASTARISYAVLALAAGVSALLLRAGL